MATGCIVGQIFLFPYRAGAPNGVSEANGQILMISQNTTLFSLLGTTYGGDGQTTFALPDLRALAPNNMQYMICLFGVFP
jgi:microcystin-dependent protein